MTALTVGAGALVVIAVLFVNRIAGRSGVTDPQVCVITQNAVEVAAARRRERYEVVKRVMTGEVATTAERVREATALAAASGMLLAVELGKGRAPAGADQLTVALLRSGKLRAFSAGAQPGTLTTAHSTLVVRYRRAPIGVEVVSLGKSREAGPAILVRTPGDEREGGPGIWLAESLDEVVIPRPFAPAAEVIATGWQPDALPPVK
jgi:hypothetical protein